MPLRPLLLATLATITEKHKPQNHYKHIYSLMMLSPLLGNIFMRHSAHG
ncbi:hypothetical protein QW180_31030 [Vibrio sinaloensis]|nr:hypothetical protein [Vibrio sinaloensis]